MEWQGIAVIALLVGFAVVAWWAKSQGAAEKAIEAALASAKKDADIVEKSNEAAQAADSRRDPAVHGVPNVVQPNQFPDWLKPR